jgi:Mn-containing catalase
VTGQPEVDLRSNIAAEARAKITYERLIAFCDDQGSKDALQFLMTREITHMKAFMQALEGLGKGPLEIGKLPPSPGLVDQFFDDSTGEGPDGETDMTPDWAVANGFQLANSPAFYQGRSEVDSSRRLPKAKRSAKR